MIYILNLVETMKPIAVNSLLKFLEEPGKNVFAFLTTENESKVLPTIISRTQVLRFRDIDRNKIINDSLALGVSEEDSQMLSGFYSDSEKIKLVSESKEYQTAKDSLKIQLEALTESSSKAVYISQKEIASSIKTQESARLYLKMLGEIFQDLLNLNVNETITLKSYDNILHAVLPHLSNIDKSYAVIVAASKKLDVNVNIALLLDHIIYQITQEGK